RRASSSFPALPVLGASGLTETVGRGDSVIVWGLRGGGGVAGPRSRAARLVGAPPGSIGGPIRNEDELADCRARLQRLVGASALAERDLLKLGEAEPAFGGPPEELRHRAMQLFLLTRA